MPYSLNNDVAASVKVPVLVQAFPNSQATVVQKTISMVNRSQKTVSEVIRSHCWRFICNPVLVQSFTTSQATGVQKTISKVNRLLCWRFICKGSCAGTGFSPNSQAMVAQKTVSKVNRLCC